MRSIVKLREAPGRKGEFIPPAPRTKILQDGMSRVIVAEGVRSHQQAGSASGERMAARRRRRIGSGSRFSEEQIIGVLRENEAGAKTEEVCRRHGISSATFYKWKAKYGGLELSEAKRLKGLEDEKNPPCTFLTVTSHRLFESPWPNGSADQKSLDALSTSPQAGILKPIPQPVDPVVNAFLYCLVVSGEYEYGRLAGSARYPPCARSA